MDIASLLGNVANSLPVDIIAALGVGVLRNVAGYFENKYVNKLNINYDIKQLPATVLKYFAFITILSLGIDTGPAIAASLGIDLGVSAIKKAGTATPAK